MSQRKTAKKQETGTAKQVCGIIMPIAGCTYKDTEYSEVHWDSMRLFLEDAIADAGFDPRAVWEDQKQSAIHARIVNNITEFPVVVCVLCGTNPNVLIELGLRLMTDKPVFMIHDRNNFPLPFDIGPLGSAEIPIPPELEYADYKKLGEQIKNDLPKMLEPEYKPFLSYFKQVVPKAVGKVKEVELVDFMNETRSAIQDIRNVIIPQVVTPTEDGVLSRRTDDSIQRDFYLRRFHAIELNYKTASARPRRSREEYEEIYRDLRMLRHRIMRNERIVDPELVVRVNELLMEVRRSLMHEKFSVDK